MSKSIFVIKHPALAALASGAPLPPTPVEAASPPSSAPSRAQFFTWPHPKHEGKLIKVLLFEGVFFEVSAVESPLSTTQTSWFVDNSVVSNGTLFLATPLDPLLLVLPFLLSSRGGSGKGCFTSLFQSLGAQTTRLPQTDLLFAHFTANPARLTLICDTIEASGTQYRVDDEKLHSLLTRKVAKTAVALLDTPALRPASLARPPAPADGSFEAHAAAAAAAAAAEGVSFEALVERTCKTAAATQLVTAALAYASEYLPVSVATALVGLFTDEKGTPLNPETVLTPANKAKMGAGARVNAEGALTGDLDVSKPTNYGSEKRSTPAVEEKKTAGDRARAKLAKSAVGMGSIASFFKKI